MHRRLWRRRRARPSTPPGDPQPSLTTAHHAKERCATSQALLPTTVSASAQSLGRQSSSGAAPSDAPRSIATPTTACGRVSCLAEKGAVGAIAWNTRPPWPASRARAVAARPRSRLGGQPRSGAWSVPIVCFRGISHRGPSSPIGHRDVVSMGGFDPIEQAHRHPKSMGIGSSREATAR